MQDIINPIDRALLKAELTKEKRLRSTNKSKNEIYIVTAHDSPNVMQEIGRLREVAFRYYGGGTGFPVDRMVNRSWRPRTCLISQRNLSRRSFLIR